MNSIGRLLAPLLLVFTVFSHAEAKEGGTPTHPPDAPSEPPWETPPPPADTIKESDPSGYLEVRSDVTPAGELRLSLPIWAPQGRSGVEPKVGITYRSRGGNDLLGVGFSLNAGSEIQRCGQTIATDGKVTGANFTAETRFCLDGQRLIVVSGTYGESGSEYRVERDGFDKIKYWEGNLFAPGTFEVWTKDGHIATYEGLKVSRAEPWASPPYTLAPVEYVDALWVLRELKDRAGNRVVYHYKTLAYPQQAEAFSLEYLPERIEYTLRKGDSSGEREIRFLYEDRPDPSFAFLSGVRMRSTKRLKSIELYAPNPASKEKVGSYEFTYMSSASTKRSLLNTISRCDAQSVCLWGKQFQWENSARPDFDTIDLGIAEVADTHFVLSRDTGLVVYDADGDGKDDLLYRLGADYFLRKTNAAGTPLGDRIWIDPVKSGGDLGLGFENIDLGQSRPVDVDGDGSNELFAAQLGPGPSYHIFRWDAASGGIVTTGLSLWVSLLGNGNSSYLEAIHFGDLDGDALPEILHQNYVDQAHPFWNILKNTGGGGFANAVPTQVEAYCARTARIVDGNGDGRAEIWNAKDSLCTQSITMGQDSAGTIQVEGQPGLGYESKRVLLVDLNGDGLRDLVKPTSTGGWVRWSTGAGYGPIEDLVNGPTPDANVTAEMDQGTSVADINSDGREDILAFRFSPAPSIIAYLSLGDGSFDAVELTTWPGFLQALEGFTTTRPGDFNGDGLIDIVKLDLDGHFRVLVQKPGQVDVVSAIWDHLVAEHPREVVHYSNAWSDSPEPTVCIYPQRCIKHGMPVVREHWTWQGEDIGEYRKTLYSYEDPRVDLLGRGFLGFGKMSVWDADRPSETTITFDNETRSGTIYPYAGLPKTVTHVTPILTEPPASLPASATARVSRVENTYGITLVNGWKTHFVFPSSWTSDEWEQSVLVQADGIDVPGGQHQNILRHRQGSTAFDAYGNLTKAEEETQGGVYRKVENTYEIRPNEWLISLLKTNAVTSTRSGAGPPAPLPEPRTSTLRYDALGFLETVQVEPTSADLHQQLTTTFTRNGDGLVTLITWEAPGEAPRHLHVAYEGAEGIFPSHTWNDLGFTESFIYHPAYGLLAVSTDVRGVETRRQYDGFGRLVRIKADGEGGMDAWQSAYIKDGWVRGLIQHVSSDAGAESYVINNDIGRPIEHASRAFDGQWARSATTYNLLGHVVAVTRPELGWISANKSVHSFDTLGRLLKIVEPDGATTLQKHTFFETRSWDASAHQSFLRYDLDERIVESTDILDGKEIPTKYVYGDFDQIETVTDSKTNKIILGYDKRGRRTSVIDPDRGQTLFEYNGLSELLWEDNALPQKNSLGKSVSYFRDAIGRVETREDTDGITKYAYDQGSALGKLTEATAPDGTKTTLAYDGLGRPWTSTWEIGGEKYTMTARYDPFGRLGRVEYPEVASRPGPRFTVDFVYNAFDYLESIQDPVLGGKPLWTVQGRNADGALTQAESGNGVLNIRSYSPLTGRLDTLHTMKGVAFDVLAHTYYPNGNLHERIDMTSQRVETFKYDDLDRLTNWELKSAAGTRETAYGFDEIGNLTTVKVNQVLQEDNAYGLGGKPHALSTTLTGDYYYDEIGRNYEGGGREIAYTAFDLPKSVTKDGKDVKLGYDAFQRRVQKSMASGGTVFVAGLYERRDKDGSIEHVFYVPGELGPAAEVHFNETTPQETTRFLHEDALGSVRVVTDESGAPVGKTMFFEPFGQRVQEDGSAIPPNFTPPVDLGFTGHNHDDDVGLINMRGRVFDPAIRRFLTPDPYVPRPLFGQSYNRYSYTDNNPVNFRDPSGFTGVENKPVGSGEVSSRVTAISAPAFLRQLFGKSPASTSASTAKGTTPSPNAAKSDSQGIGEPTGAMSPASRAPSPVSVPESQVLGSAQVSADGEGDSEGDLEAESWKDNTAVQAIGGFAAGVALGAVPFGGLGERVATAGGALPQGTMAAQIGKSLGEILGGLGIAAVGGAGSVGGAGLSATGIGAVVGVPAVAISSTLVVGGLASAAAGVQGLTAALTTGAGDRTSDGGGSGGAGRSLRVVNSKMGHAAQRAVERAGFNTTKEATEALRAFGEGIERNGLPSGSVRDAVGHFVVPGFGSGGAVVYRAVGNKLTLQTVLSWSPGRGTPVVP